MKYKKIIFGGLAFALVAPMAILGFGCGKKDSTAAKVDAKEVYTVSALSSMKYLSGQNNTNLKKRFSLYADSSSSRPESLTEGDLKAINNYANIFQNLLLTNENFVNVSQPGETDPYHGVYANKISSNLPNSSGGTDVFTIYYNEKDITTEIEVDDDGEEEKEINSVITGVGTYLSQTFEINGTREVEQEGDEFETSIEFTTRSSLNRDNYVTVSQSIENDEVEFEYKIYQDKKLVQKTEFEFEQENNKSELEIEFKDNLNGNTNKRKYKLVKKVDSDNVLEVSFKHNNKNEKFNITLGETENIFTFENNYSEPVLN